jgi:hypothetical protein
MINNTLFEVNALCLNDKKEHLIGHIYWDMNMDIWQFCPYKSYYTFGVISITKIKEMLEDLTLKFPDGKVIE